MNLQRKVDMQAKRIVALQKHIEELTKENAILHAKNQELSDKEFQYQVQLDMIDELQRTFTESLTEMNTVKDQYRQAIYETHQVKKDLIKRFKTLINQLKSFD